MIASLGQGGMANIYLALVGGPGGFNKLLVVKCMRADVVENIDGGLAMFLDEARLTARLVHPNIVSTYEVGEDAGTYFIAMEYLEGQTYRAVCNRTRPDLMPIEDELRILAETARGLHYAHDLVDYDGTPLRVVHRDVSPQNIFITYDGLVKLLDFGIAKTSEAEHMTQVGVIKGKIDYIAPEQLRGEPIDRRADVFALGAMLWEAVTRKRFAGGRKVGEVAKVQNRLTGGERKVREMRPDVPEALAKIVDRALALNAADRYDSASAFADAIDAFLASAQLKPSAKSLSSLVGPLFEVERTGMRKTIETQIALSKQRGAHYRAGPLPSVRPSEYDSTSGTWVRRGEDLGSRPPPPRSASVSLNSMSMPAMAAPTLQPAPSKRSRQLATALVVSVLGAFVGGTLAVMTLKPSWGWVTTPAASALAAAPAPAPTVASYTPSVRVQVSVWPETAHATLDGAPIATPFAGEFVQDNVLHQLVVKADGYRSTKQLVSFDRDSSVQVTLEKVSVPPRRSSRSEPAPAAPEVHVEPVVAVSKEPPSPPPEVEQPKSRSSMRTLDVEDPYAN